MMALAWRYRLQWCYDMCLAQEVEKYTFTEDDHALYEEEEFFKRTIVLLGPRGRGLGEGRADPQDSSVGAMVATLESDASSREKGQSLWVACRRRSTRPAAPGCRARRW